MVVSLIADNHHFLRAVAVIFLFAQICSDAIATFDVAKAHRLLVMKCESSFSGLQEISECLEQREDQVRERIWTWRIKHCSHHLLLLLQYWGEYQLLLLLRRDLASVALESLSLLVVCFIGVSLGFTHNRYSCSQIREKYSNEQRLWTELGKRGITMHNFKDSVRSNGSVSKGNVKTL